MRRLAFVLLIAALAFALGLLTGCDERRKASLPQEPVAEAPPMAAAPEAAPKPVATDLPARPPEAVPAPVAATPAPIPAPAPAPTPATVDRSAGRPVPTPARSRFSRKYDDAIERSARRWLPVVPWRLWKAQLYQESRLDPAARSPVGAEGIAQFMPGTWAQISRQMGLGTVPATSAGHAIEAGAYYMASLRKAWSAPRPERDRHDLAMASYNAGMGNLLKAQKACGGPAGYEAIMACLHMVTGRHAAETRGYAPSIRRWHAMMEAGL